MVVETQIQDQLLVLLEVLVEVWHLMEEQLQEVLHLGKEMLEAPAQQVRQIMVVVVVAELAELVRMELLQQQVTVV